MKTNTHPASLGPARLGALCLNSCRKLLAQLAELKESLLREFEGRLLGHREMLKTALTEAEALAWQTPYPHLFFPVLAEEKAVALSRWAEHQTAIRHAHQSRAFAA